MEIDGRSTPGPSHGSLLPWLRWIDSVDGHLEIAPQEPPQATPRYLATVEDARIALEDPNVARPHNLAPLAAFGMFLSARAVPPTSQVAVLLEALQTDAPRLVAAAHDAPAVRSTVDAMLNIARQHRGIGVRQLQVRLLEEAVGTLPAVS